MFTLYLYRRNINQHINAIILTSAEPVRVRSDVIQVVDGIDQKEDLIFYLFQVGSELWLLYCLGLFFVCTVLLAEGFADI